MQLFGGVNFFSSLNLRCFSLWFVEQQCLCAWLLHGHLMSFRILSMQTEWLFLGLNKRSLVSTLELFITFFKALTVICLNRQRWKWSQRSPGDQHRYVQSGVYTTLSGPRPLLWCGREHVIIAISPISTFVFVVLLVVVATSVTVVQLGQVTIWRQRASGSVEGTEVASHNAPLWLSDKDSILRKK